MRSVLQSFTCTLVQYLWFIRASTGNRHFGIHLYVVTIQEFLVSPTSSTTSLEDSNAIFIYGKKLDCASNVALLSQFYWRQNSIRHLIMHIYPYMGYIELWMVRFIIILYNLHTGILSLDVLCILYMIWCHSYIVLISNLCEVSNFK